MEVTAEEFKHCDLVKVTGRIDSATAPQLATVFDAIQEAGRFRIVFDMADVEFISSAGLRVLISTQKTLPFGTVEDCRAEAIHRVNAVGHGGGYIFAPAHCIQPDTPLENILAIYEVANGVEEL